MIDIIILAGGTVEEADKMRNSPLFSPTIIGDLSLSSKTLRQVTRAKRVFCCPLFP